VLRGVVLVPTVCVCGGRKMELVLCICNNVHSRTTESLCSITSSVWLY
jgi:hypothetical protein